MSDHTLIQLPLPIENSTVEIPLNDESSTYIDLADIDLLAFKWKLHTSGKQAYCVRYFENTYEYLHRVILSRILGRTLLPTEWCDHRDTNGLNNCRSNLRLSTPSENGSNTHKYSNNTSGYKGVSYDTFHKKWVAQIKHKGHLKRLGRFDTPELAYEAYCKAALELQGEFSRLK